MGLHTLGFLDAAEASIVVQKEIQFGGVPRYRRWLFKAHNQLEFCPLVILLRRNGLKENIMAIGTSTSLLMARLECLAGDARGRGTPSEPITS